MERNTTEADALRSEREFRQATRTKVGHLIGELDRLPPAAVAKVLSNDDLALLPLVVKDFDSVVAVRPLVSNSLRGRTGASKSPASAFANPLPTHCPGPGPCGSHRVALRPIRERPLRAATATAAAVFWLFLVV